MKVELFTFLCSMLIEEEETDEAGEKKQIKERAKQEFFAAIEEEGTLILSYGLCFHKIVGVVNNLFHFTLIGHLDKNSVATVFNIFIHVFHCSKSSKNSTGTGESYFSECHS